MLVITNRVQISYAVSIPAQDRPGVDFLFYLSLMKLIFTFPFLISLTLLTACSNSAISKKLSGSDSLVINFKDQITDSVTKTVTTIENNAIRKLIDFVDAKATDEFKCGYDGNLSFYSEGEVILPVVFKYKEPGCRHFLFELDGKLMSTKMGKEAADFLESLEKGNR